MEEVWKPVRDWEGIYEVSNFGQIASLKRGFRNVLSNRNATGWYFNVVLKWKGKRESVKLHRLIYETFVGPIPAGYQIHHIDENKQNNRVDNLQAVSAAEHIRITLEIHPSYYLAMVNRNVLRPVLQYDTNGNLIAEYMNCRDASNVTGICHRNIVQVAYGTPYKEGKYRKTAGGYVWKLKK